MLVILVESCNWISLFQSRVTLQRRWLIDYTLIVYNRIFFLFLTVLIVFIKHILHLKRLIFHLFSIVEINILVIWLRTWLWSGLEVFFLHLGVLLNVFILLNILFWFFVRWVILTKFKILPNLLRLRKKLCHFLLKLKFVCRVTFLNRRAGLREFWA